MIFYYKHKSISDLSEKEIDLLGYEGVLQYAYEHNMDPKELFQTIKSLEEDIKEMGRQSFDMTQGENLQLMNKWTNSYIDYFNNNANYDKQAYVILGNIASGKSTYASTLESSTKSLIIDPDNYKMGKQTKHGYFEGFTSLYHEPTDREKMQDPCSDAAKKTIDEASSLGMNIILPKATTSLEKLEKQLKILTDRGYDIHLILFETPIQDCANRNYFRYLIKEYEKQPTHELDTHGRFVPVSIITNIGDNTFTTFAKAYNAKRFSSYKAFYNEGSYGSKISNYANDEIDLKTMIMPE